MSTTTAVEKLQEKLRIRRPTILFLGQSYLLGSSNNQGFIGAISHQFGISGESTHSGLDQLLEKISPSDISADLRYLHRRSESVPISEELYTISEFAWSSVFTTAIDEVWVRSFKKPWRSLKSVFTEQTWPLETRDHNQLCSSFLFGCVDKEDADCRIPVDTFSLDEKYQTAISLLRRLPEIATPLGLVLIDGYDPKIDWLKVKDLYPIINSLAPGQAFLFSQERSILEDKYLSKLQADGKLEVVQSHLADFLQKAAKEGVVQFGDPAIKLPTGRQITIDGVPHAIPKEFWQKLSSIAVILDDNILIPPPELSADQQYMDYRNFLADPVRSNDWSGYGRGYAFKRDFERTLQAECINKLRQKRLQLDPVLLHGESGTGKTVAMASVAYSIASESTYPVLFIERSISNPDWRPIDRFLNWAEDCGATACLLVWDGMRGDDQYLSLQRKLADRGRKVLVVGSTYLREKVAREHLEAPRELNAHERDAFKLYLKRYVPDFERALDATHVRIDQVFLVALYRILPSSRPKLAKGVTGELEYAGKDILERIKASETSREDFNSLQVAFQNLPFFQETESPKQDIQSAEDKALEAQVRELIALVMVPGKYGFKIPIELLLSALGRGINSATITALQSGVLIWSEQTNGDILVGPRHSLEAKMYIDTYYGNSAESESDFIKKIVLGLKRGGNSDGHVNFIVDLLRHVGPNSPIERNKIYFQRCILRFAEALTELRKEKSFLSPRLMLQEGSFLREAVRSLEAEMPAEDRQKLLRRAEDVLVEAKSRADCSDALRSSINAELAACYGSMIQTLAPNHAADQEVPGLYDNAKDALKEAMRRNSANAHALVTLGWISRNALDSQAFSGAERSEIQAELLYQFDDAVPSTYDSIQLEYFLKEKMRIMESLGKQELAQSTFDELRKSGSKAGYFLKARSMFGEFPTSDISKEELTSMSRAEAFLQANWKEILNDERCLGLYLNVWWFIRTREARFAKEKQVLPFTESDWSHLEMVSSSLKALKEPDPPAWLRFITALALFHCGDVQKSIHEFREISKEPNLQVGGKRLVKYFVASKDGKPCVYDGIVRQRVEDSRMGEIWVNQIRHAVPITPRDFDERELRQNQPINDFHIAFSFAGPMAQPTHFLRTKASQYGR